MELDELKKQLNQRIETRQGHSAADISALLKKDTRSVVQKIKRSLTIELSLTIAFTIGCVLAVAFVSKWSYVTFFTGFGIVGFIVSAALCYMLWKTNKLASSALTVRKNLEAIISIIQQYVWVYLRLGMGLLPLSFGIAFWLGYNDPIAAHKPIRWDIFLYMLAGLLVFSYASFRFTRWYLQKLYSNYTEQLKELLKEFDED
jgi:hypothetical protein